MSEYVQLFGNTIINLVVADDPYVDVTTNQFEGTHFILLEDIPLENRHTMRPGFVYNEKEKKVIQKNQQHSIHGFLMM